MIVRELIHTRIDLCGRLLLQIHFSLVYSKGRRDVLGFSENINAKGRQSNLIGSCLSLLRHSMISSESFFKLLIRISSNRTISQLILTNRRRRSFLSY